MASPSPISEDWRRSLVIAAQLERAQIVVSLRDVGLRGNHLLKRSGGLIEIAVLEHRHTIREIVALKCILLKLPIKRKSLAQTVFSVRWHVAEIRQEFVARQPMARIGRPEEIASLAVFLASDESSYATGAVHVIDGGFSL